MTLRKLGREDEVIKVQESEHREEVERLLTKLLDYLALMTDETDPPDEQE